ncbi:AAA family ATPase [Spirulina sp. CCNP1310]|uniref:AAA family ATPase n=1 Tax=Spirulina sp. CCNP1310 TaxID=3110249 RepID=UPI003A4C5C0D
MLNNIELRNFGPIHQLECNNLGQINLIIGRNGTGKTILLKSLYSAMRTVEAYQRGHEPRTAAEILADKLYWTFEAEKIGDLVSKGADLPLRFKFCLDDCLFFYEFGKDTTRNISKLENHIPSRNSNSIYLPTKEVLSLHQNILQSRDIYKTFGFDDTYLDLARALQQPRMRGKNYQEFAHSRAQLKDMLDGRVEYDQKSGRWQFKKGNQKFAIGVTAEGIKKIAILDTLLGNRYLDPQSIVFIDEPESALHPIAISQFLDIIVMLAEVGIQFFLASHSYFVIKKLYLAAQQRQNLSIVILSADESSSGEQWDIANLREGLPTNPIIDESIRLYREEVKLVLE